MRVSSRAGCDPGRAAVSGAVSQPTTTSPIMRAGARAARFGEVDAEEVAEGVPVGDLEDAVGADHQVDVDRVDVGAERPGSRPRSRISSSSVVAGAASVRSESSRRMNSPRWMFSIATSRMNAWWSTWWSKVSSASLRDRGDRVDVIDLQLLLGLADAAVGVLEDGEVELLLAAEVVVDHPLRRARALGDVVDPRARVARLRRTPPWRRPAARLGCARRRAESGSARGQDRELTGERPVPRHPPNVM